MIRRRGQLGLVGMSVHGDPERRRPMREDAIFRIYSMSKPITSIALMTLSEERLIGLNDDVAIWHRCGSVPESRPNTSLARKWVVSAFGGISCGSADF